MVGLPGADGPAPGHGAGCDAADVSWFHLRPGYGSRRSPDLGRGPRTRPGLLHPQPCGGDLLIPQQRHRRPVSLGPVRLRSDLRPGFSFRGRRPYHRPHHRQGHGRQPHRPETRRQERPPKPPNKQQPEPKPNASQNHKQRTHEPHESSKNYQKRVGIDLKSFRPTVTMTQSVAGRKIALQDS